MFGSIRKFIAAAIGVFLAIATAMAGLWFIGPGQVRDTIAIVIAVLTPLAVYVFPNDHHATG